MANDLNAGGGHPSDAADVRGGPHAARAVYRRLVAAFEIARTADVRRRVETDGQLREALQAAQALGDYAGLPCPVRLWRAALLVFSEWLAADDDTRAGATGRIAYVAVTTLLEFESGRARATPRGGAFYGDQRRERGEG